jgi:CBS domain-containing protein
MWIWIFTGIFFLILIALITINWKINKSFKIETAWLAIALAPAVIWLLATGQLTEFSGFGLAFKLKQASAKPFSLKLEGDRIKPASVTTGDKGSMSQIPRLVDQRVAALSFKLNRRGYYANWAIQDYLEKLTRYDFFQYVIFTDLKGQFRGMMPARDLLTRMREEKIDVVKIIEEGAIDRLPNVVRVSIEESGYKKEALKMMEDAKISQLPVVDTSDRFVGIVERDKLTSSILLQLVAQL